MSVPANCQLLFGPYRPPALRRGDRATCLVRDGEVIITSWSDGRISWPRCRAIGSRGGSGLLVDEELARAVRSESVAAVKFWWGVGVKAVWHWRRALGVGRIDNEGTRRLMAAAAKLAAAVNHERGMSDKTCDLMSQRAKERGLGKLQPGYHGPWWTTKELKLLGKLPDAEVAKKIGRTTNAVRIRRTMLGIPSARDRRRSR